MKKILFAVDGVNFSEGAFEFIRRLNTIEPVLVTGVFMPQVDYANLWSYAAAAGAGSVYMPLLEDEEAESINRNIQYFTMLCRQNKIAFRLHKDVTEFALPALKKESRFADLTVIGGELFYKGVLELNQMDYLTNVLHETECPVIIVPEHFEFPKTNMLAYDGTGDSVFAIKQFAYLFPEFTANKTWLVYAEEDQYKDFPSREYILELAGQHFPDLTFYKLEMNPRKYFSAWIGEKPGTILVSGSFSRTSISQLFRRSFVSDVIRKHQIPVFIAHR